MVKNMTRVELMLYAETQATTGWVGRTGRTEHETLAWILASVRQYQSLGRQYQSDRTQDYAR